MRGQAAELLQRPVFDALDGLLAAADGLGDAVTTKRLFIDAEVANHEFEDGETNLPIVIRFGSLGVLLRCGEVGEGLGHKSWNEKEAIRENPIGQYYFSKFFLWGLSTSEGAAILLIVHILPLNLHLHARCVDVPLFALIDDSLAAEASKIRWLTSGKRPVHSKYDPESKKSAPESLARWVWARSKSGPMPRYLANANADLLDCRVDNLIDAVNPSLARSGKTGEVVHAEIIRLLGENTPAEIRKILGFSEAGVSAKRGKKASVSTDQLQQILDARLTVASSLSLKTFNAEVVAEIVGTQLNPVTLSKLMKGKISPLEGFDYSKIIPFRRH